MQHAKNFKVEDTEDVAIPIDKNGRWFPDFPNARSYVVTQAKLEEKFKSQFFPLKCKDKFEKLDKDIFKISKSDYMFIPQDDPRWLALRGMPRITGSVLAELLGFHDKQAGSYLGIPPIMYITEPHNCKWSDFAEKLKYGYVPSWPMDPPGNVACAHGDHEENVLATLMAKIKPMQLRQVGLVIVTEKELSKFNIVNVFKNNERITSLPFELGISGDFDATVPDCVVEDEDGNPIYGEMIEVAGECKAPTPFGAVYPQTASARVKNPGKPETLFGAEYYFKKGGAKPYEHPKEYYVPQTFGEMLALGRRANLFCSWSYGNGMTVWKIDMQERYLSLMLSVLIYLYEKFVAKGDKVPTDYFFHLADDDKAKKFYIELLDLTKRIALESPVYLHVSGTDTRRITDEIGVSDKRTFLKFPDIPEDVMPPYQVLGMYARRLYKDFKDLKWISNSRDIDGRNKQLYMLSDTELTRFSKGIIESILKDKTNYMIGPNRDIDGSDMPVMQHKALEKAELYLIQVYKTVFVCYGRPEFGKELDMGYFFGRIVMEVCSAWDVVNGSDETTCGDISTFDPLKHVYVLTNEWVAKFAKACETKYGKHREIDILVDKTVFPAVLPKIAQYERLIAILVIVEKLEPLSSKGNEKKINK